MIHLRTNRWRLLVVLLLLAAGLSGCIVSSGPHAVLTAASVSGDAPFEVRFNLSLSSHSSNRSMTYRLEFGDDTPPADGDDLGLVVRHTYTEQGTYTATLTLTDTDGRQGTDELQITVSNDGPPVGLDVGLRAPNFTAHTTDGGEMTLADLLGQVVLLDFWGAWCTPCRQSMPHLHDLWTDYHADGLAVVIVSTDAVEQDSIDFLAANGYNGFISVWEPGGKAGNRIAQLYGVSSSSVGIPRTFLLDREGIIRAVAHPLSMTGGIIEALL